MSLRGPAEATEAMRGPAILAGESAGEDGFTPPFPGLRRFAAS